MTELEKLREKIARTVYGELATEKDVTWQELTVGENAGGEVFFEIADQILKHIKDNYILTEKK